MEESNSSSTSLKKSDVMDNDDNYEHLSTEELCVKINTFRNLCLGNKINTSNAFDIDMIGYFLTWLEKRKDNYNEDVASFQEIADYLEACAKVYGFRVDNISESTSKFVEQFRALNYKKNDANGQNKIVKPKRTKFMLTTNDKLKRKISETDNIGSVLKQGIPTIDINKLFETGCTSKYMISLYSNTSLQEEIFRVNKEEIKYNNKETFTMPNLKNEISKRTICPGFDGFVAECDQINNDMENHSLEGIENQFDFDIHKFQNCNEDLFCDDNNKDDNNFDSSSNHKDQEKSKLNELLDCIDNVNRDYSFFNPKLLAKWKGPEAWKAQAMLNALKSFRLCGKKRLNEDNNNLQQAKTVKKRNKVANIKFDESWWLKLENITKTLDKKIKEPEKISRGVLKKWDPLNNLCDDKKTIFNLTHKSSFLEYFEFQPDWISSTTLTNVNIKENSNNASPNHQNIYDHEESAVGALENSDDLVDFNNPRTQNDQNLLNSYCNTPIQQLNNDKDNILKEFKAESKMDIGLLKKEISKIIDLECVEVDNCDWSSQLSFKKLHSNLLNIHQKGISVPIVVVGLLHLTNERGLKLFQEPSNTINDLQEIFIAKPMYKK